MFGLVWREVSALDVAQTLALIVMTGVLIYAVQMIGRLVRGAAA